MFELFSNELCSWAAGAGPLSGHAAPPCFYNSPELTHQIVRTPRRAHFTLLVVGLAKREARGAGCNPNN